MTDRVIEFRAMKEQARRSKHLHERQEQWDVNAAEMADACYGTASCLILSHLINHAFPILSNELSNTSVWLCYKTAPQPLILSL